MEDLTRQLTEFILERIPLQAELVKVVAVDQGKLECTILLNEVEIEGVNLTPTSKKTGLIQIPKAGSHVIISTLHNEEGDYFVSLFGEIEEVILITENKERVKITSSEVVFDSGENGGLIKIEELKSQLNKNTQAIQKILDVFSGWTPVVQDGGAALKTQATSNLTGLQLANFANIENDKIKH